MASWLWCIRLCHDYVVVRYLAPREERDELFCGDLFGTVCQAGMEGEVSDDLLWGACVADAAHVKALVAL